MFAGYTRTMLVTVFIIACMVLCSKADECIYDDRGLCMESCPPGTISYVSPCGSGNAMSQRTCSQPIARSIGSICDWSRCDCPAPKVWDENAKKCVILADCSVQNFVTEDN